MKLLKIILFLVVSITSVNAGLQAPKQKLKREKELFLLEERKVRNDAQKAKIIKTIYAEVSKAGKLTGLYLNDDLEVNLLEEYDEYELVDINGKPVEYENASKVILRDLIKGKIVKERVFNLDDVSDFRPQEDDMLFGNGSEGGGGSRLDLEEIEKEYIILSYPLV